MISRVYGLHQRRMAYLDRLGKGLLYRLGIYSDSLSRQRAERTKSVFESLEEAIRWVRERLDRLNNMVFHEDLEALEELFEQHKIDNRDIQDFHQTVKECIARQVGLLFKYRSDLHGWCNFRPRCLLKIPMNIVNSSEFLSPSINNFETFLLVECLTWIL